MNNHPPIVYQAQTETEFTEGGSPVLLFPSIIINDNDEECVQDMLRSATVRLSSSSADFFSEEVSPDSFSGYLV